MAPRLEEFEVRPNESITSNENTTTTTTRQRTAAATPLIRREEAAKKEPQEIELPIVWRNVAVFTMLHLGALYGVYLCFYAKWQTLLFGIFNNSVVFFIVYFVSIIDEFISLRIVLLRWSWHNCWRSSTLGSSYLQG